MYICLFQTKILRLYDLFFFFPGLKTMGRVGIHASELKMGRKHSREQRPHGFPPPSFLCQEVVDFCLPFPCPGWPATAVEGMRGWVYAWFLKGLAASISCLWKRLLWGASCHIKQLRSDTGREVPVFQPSPPTCVTGEGHHLGSCSLVSM